MRKNITFSFFSLILLLFTAVSSQAQGTQIQFGQNRVQYKDFTWQFYESANFSVYFNQGGQNLGRFASLMAEADLEDIQNMLDYKLSAKPEIIIYNNISDFNQTNIATGTELLYNTGGKTTTIGNKIFVYFDGNHQNLRRQIREGIGRILISNMVFGGNLQEIVQNAVLLNLPEWFTEGLVSYIGSPWNSELDNKLREGIMSGKYKKFNRLTGDDAKFAGHALWYFIAEKYGEANIPNLLYLIRINRSLENGFLFVLGSSVNQTVDDWYQYFYDRYTLESKDKQQPDTKTLVARKTKKNLIYHETKISPDGKTIAYVSDDYGKFKVYVQPLDKKAADVIKKGGLKTRSLATDQSYPLVCWAPDSRNVAVIYEKRGKMYVLTYDLDKKEKEVKEISRWQKILDASYAKDNKTLVMSVMQKGQSDIFLYYLQNARTEQITNDYYDDLHPRWIKTENGYEGIVFSSNRDEKRLGQTNNIDTILPVGNFNLYFYNYKTKSENLVQVTHTKNISEKNPIQIDAKHFAYLSDQNGIVNRFAGYLDTIYDHTNTVVYFKDSTVVNPKFDIAKAYERSDFDSIKYVKIYRDTAYVFPITNYATNIIEHDASMKTGKVIETFRTNNSNQFYISKVPSDLSAVNAGELNNTNYRNFIDAKKDIAFDKTNANTVEVAAVKSDTSVNKKTFFNSDFKDTTETELVLIDTIQKKVINDGMYFQNEFPEADADELAEFTPVILDNTNNPDQTNISANGIKQTRIQPYKIKYSNQFVLSQLDNSLFINKYQSFNASGGSFINPDLSGLFTISITDLFEDYRFTGGIRFPTSFSGGEYFLTYEDLRSRIDKRLTWYYSSERNQYTFQPVWFPVVEANNRTNIIEASAKYPFDVVRSVRASVSYRSDKIVFLAGDTFSLNLPNYKEDWVNIRLEYVHDNTYPVMTNILNGTRYKIWAEVHKQFAVNLDEGVDISLNDGFLGLIGYDFRHYQKLHRQIIWANRFAGGVSFGPQKMIYYLGGVDSWLLPEFNYSTEINLDQNYVYQTLATPVRGYEQNIRNGNAYAVFNSEVRVPIFSYLIAKPIKSDLIKNFQAVAFFDAGSAWEGLSPFEQDNPYNTVTVGQDPLQVDVNFFRDPVVAGFGYGLRTTIFGYFLRVDRAYGIELNGLTDPRWYFSLSLDF
ncbi:MAG: PD40 domain-containing protein [Fimbriimonadaceae bacterium]|nr:PD40 domain-containing protein [Chitinophagales bacterium]